MSSLAPTSVDGRTVVVFVGIFGVTYAAMKWFTKRSGEHKYPPCIRSLPIVGSLPFLPAFEKMNTGFLDMTQQLGNVFTCYLGHRYTLIINGFDAVHEALSKRSTDFASRPDFYVNHVLFNPNFKGIIDRPYDSGFKKNHQLSLTILKDFGFGQTIMEDRIRMEVEELLEGFRQIKGEGTYPRDLITQNVLNVIASIVLGSRFNHGDPKFATLVSAIHHYIADSMDLVPLNMLPLLRVLPRIQEAVGRVRGFQEQMFEIIEEKITSAAASEAGTSFAASFIHAEEGSLYDKEELVYTMRDLLLAGTETSATTLQWALVLMADNPDIQKRLQHDIDALVPRDRLPSLSDKVKLPYVEATICEILRRRTIVPLGIPHETLCDTELQGYFIPKGTSVFINHYSCHMDPRSWTEPEVFRPERFLDADNKLILRDRVVAFSLGKRSCLGELLARQEIYLFFTGLLQNFDILPDVGQNKVDFKEQYSVTVGPADYKIRLVNRPIVQ